MSDNPVRLDQLDLLADPTSGFTLVTTGGKDYKTPTSVFPLTKNNLSEYDPVAARKTLNVPSVDDLQKAAPPTMNKFVQALYSALQIQGAGLQNITDIAAELLSDKDKKDAFIINFLNGLENSNVATSVLRREVSDLHTRFIESMNAVLNQLTAFDGISLAQIKTQQLNTLMAVQILGNLIAPLDGFDPSLGGSGSGGSSGLKYPNSYVFGAPKGIIRIDLSSETGPPTSKDVGTKASIKMNVDGEVMTSLCLMYIQGASSAGYPKKNIQCEFFRDTNYDKNTDVKIGEVIPHNEWNFKANWIDQTQARNLLCYRLWDVVVSSRRGWPKREIDASYVGKLGVDAFDTGATGHPIGYPCVVYMNDAFYGIGTWMVGKKKGNYNIPKNDPLKIQIGLDDHVNLMTLEGTGWSMKAPSKPTDDTNAAIANWCAFASSAQADFTTNSSKFLDTNNIVDFFLFITFLNAYDCSDKNTQIITYDGQKWYFMVYDLDTTLGLNWNGGSVGGQTADPFSYNRDGVEFWNKIKVAYAPQINARYKVLRDNGTFSINQVYDLYREIQTCYNPDMVAAEFKAWPTLPSWNQSTFDQINSWLTARLPYLDNRFNYTKP